MTTLHRDGRDGLTGTITLMRLAVRLDRVRLPVWVYVLGVLPAITAEQYRALYPDAASLRQVSGMISNQALVALNGPLFAAGSIGALTAWKITMTELVLVALMCILTVVRHSRADEEAGRLELLGAGVLGRSAPLAAALSTAVLAAAATGLITSLGLLVAKQPAVGSFALGAGVFVTGAVFAGVAGLAAQAATTGRAAIMISVGVLGVAYLLRALGDAGPTGVSYASPIGWAMRVRAFAGERWWLLAPGAVLAAVLCGAALTVSRRRDLGFGLVAQGPGPAGSERLRGTFALAWRQQRGVLAAWIVALAVWGAVLGGAAKGISGIDNSQMTDVLARLGGRGPLADAYLAATLGITGLVVAAYAIQATLRLHAEESAGHVEPLLAASARRIRWATGHLAIAAAGTVALLTVTGVAAGLAYGAQVHDVAGQVGRLTAGALVQAPAVWVLAGLGAALFGAAPRLSALAWAALVACLVVLEVGEVLGLTHWLLDVSPFAHVPKLPSATWHAGSAAPLAWLVLIAAALAAAGLAAFRHRDIQ